MRVTLRAMVDDDFDSFVYSFTDPLIRDSYIGIPPEFTIKDIRKLFDIEKKESYVISVKGYYLGLIGLQKKLNESTFEFGYNILKDYRNKGIATKAIRIFVDNHRHINLVANPISSISEKVLIKNGFTKKKDSTYIMKGRIKQEVLV